MEEAIKTYHLIEIVGNGEKKLLSLQGETPDSAIDYFRDKVTSPEMGGHKTAFVVNLGDKTRVILNSGTGDYFESKALEKEINMLKSYNYSIRYCYIKEDAKTEVAESGRKGESKSLIKNILRWM